MPKSPIKQTSEHSVQHHLFSFLILASPFPPTSSIMPKTIEEELLQDFSHAAASYFATTRIPASIVTGSSLGALFALGKFSDQADRTSLERLLIKLYRLLAWTSFILSLNANIICTMASTKILHSQFDPMAETSYLLLKREFTFEFVSVKWSMAVSLLLFIAIVTVRLFLELDLTKDVKRRDTAMFVGFSAVSLTCHLLGYINDSLYNWSNIGEMTVDLVLIILDRAWNEPTIMRTVAVVSSFISCAYGIKSAMSDNGDKDKKD